MKKISFTINIRNKTYNGHLIVNDFSETPKNFLVFMENHIVGELMYRHKWQFEQGRRHKILGRLNNDECRDIAEYLGNIFSFTYDRNEN